MSRVYNIVDDNGDLGATTVTVGCVVKFRFRLCTILDEGVHITSATPATNSATTTAGAASLSDDKENAYFLLTTGAIEEVVTATVTFVLSDGQTLKYTISIDVLKVPS